MQEAPSDEERIDTRFVTERNESRQRLDGALVRIDKHQKSGSLVMPYVE